MPKDIPQHGYKPRKVSHTPTRIHRQRERRSSASERGYDARWVAFRRSFLLGNPLCEYCLARGKVTPATVVDHDLPHEHDPELFWSNTFTALCKHDHDSTKQRMERKYKGDDLLDMIAIMKGKTE